MNRQSVLSIIFAVISFIVFVKVIKWVGYLIPVSPTVNFFVVFFVLVFLIPISMLSGKLLSEYFLEN